MGFFGFGGNKQQPAQQFGAPSLAAQQQQYGQMNGMQNGMMGGMGGMGGLGMMQQAQNPMMQQAANDPIIATSQLLSLYDPVSQFVITQNMALVMDLVGEIMMLSIKEFFANVSFKIEGEKMTLDASSMPSDLGTMSPENLALTLQKVQGAAQNVLNHNQQQIQMFLQAHQQGSMMNQQQGGVGASMGRGVGMAATGAAML